MAQSPRVENEGNNSTHFMGPLRGENVLKDKQGSDRFYHISNHLTNSSNNSNSSLTLSLWTWSLLLWLCMWLLGNGTWQIGRKTNGVQEEKDAGVTSRLQD